MNIQFRSTYRGVADYDVFGRSAKRLGIISEYEGGVTVRVTEHGEAERLTGPEMLTAFDAYKAKEHERFLAYCAAHGLDPQEA
jgi:hypothetical protein